MSISKKYKLKVIEDCAHAVEAEFMNKKTGTFGDLGCFSFYATKNVVTGEGGMVVSNNLKIIEQVNTLKAFGITTPPELRSKPGTYDVQSLGFNYRMTDIQAALGVGQLERYSENVFRRRKNARLYSQFLKNEEKIFFTNC